MCGQSLGDAGMRLCWQSLDFYEEYVAGDDGSMAGLALQETPVGEILSLPLYPTYYSCSLTTPGVWLLRQLLLLENVIQQPGLQKYIKRGPLLEAGS